MSLTTLLHSLTQHSRRRTARRTKSPADILAAEQLESRQLLTGNVTATYDAVDKVLTFNGDASNNAVTFAAVNGTEPDAIVTGVNGTTINGSSSLSIGAFTNQGDITTVIINGGGGADTVTVDTSSLEFNFPVSVLIDGGSGNDSVFVGSPGGQDVHFSGLTVNGGFGRDLVSLRSNLVLPTAVFAALSGGGQNDRYLFDTDNSLGRVRINETTGAGVDTVDFSSTGNRPVSLRLSSTATQVVNAGLRLRLSAGNVIENVNGGSKNDRLIGNALNNRLNGNAGNDILVGLYGNDRLEGRGGRDVLVGGGGLDVLIGGASDDILIGARTTADTNIAKLNDIRSEWISQTSYASRVSDLRTGVGATNVSLQAGNNVLDDGGKKDTLNGGSGKDWYFSAIDDVITNLVTGELVDEL